MAVVRDPKQVEGRRGTVYPPPLNEGFDGRVKRALTPLLGLTQIGVNWTTLEPGAKSSQRHWHAEEEELILVIEGEVTLVTNEGEQVLTANMCAGFPRGEPNGHHLVNRSDKPATYLELGTRSANDDVTYPDVDMAGEKRDGRYRFKRKNGEPYV